MKKYIILLLAIITITSCTQNSRAKSFGGTAEVVLPKGKKLVTATWKDSNLWYLTKDMTEDDVAETYEFHEESSMGVMEGTYRIIEVK
tara:strand:- start:402 stop:665 length:264 start_codon:yes stop_codon:yes gene_type:complete